MAKVVHHVSYERLGAEDLRDLAVVCHSCHKKIHNLEKQTLDEYLEQYGNKIQCLKNASKKILGFSRVNDLTFKIGYDNVRETTVISPKTKEREMFKLSTQSEESVHVTSIESTPSGESRKVLITPDIAQKLLEKNTNNRPLSMSRVKSLANDMKEGHWLLNSDAISINVNGELTNGQHRLQAVILSNEPQWFFLAENLHENVFLVTDTGLKPRSAGTVLTLAGEKNTATIAAAIKILYNVDCGNIKGNKAVSSTQVIELLNSLYRDLDFTIPTMNSIKSGSGLLSPGITCALAFHFQKIDPVMSEKFFDDLNTGANLQKGSPILTLRNTLIKNKIGASKLPTWMLWIYTVKAWNAFRAGKSLSLMRFNPETDTIPTPA